MQKPTFKEEVLLWAKGYRVVAGVDEVGRGSFAGPIVAGAVAFAQDSRFPPAKAWHWRAGMIYDSGVTISDSKKLRPMQRERAAEWIKENALGWGIGNSSVSEINKLGIKKSTEKAIRRAIVKLNKKTEKLKNLKIDFLLIDAFYIPYVSGLQVPRKNARKNPRLRDSRAKQKAIVDGDGKVFSIAAASIIAKVYRDKLMVDLSNRYKKYGWERNKGYGTSKHREAIVKFGTTRQHRKKFVETFVSNSKTKKRKN